MYELEFFFIDNSIDSSVFFTSDEPGMDEDLSEGLRSEDSDYRIEDFEGYIVRDEDDNIIKEVTFEW
jgi:hypothetical protein